MTAAAAPRSVTSFGAVCAALTGYPAASAADAAKLLAAFGTPARRAALTRLARVVDAAAPADPDSALRAQGLDGIADALVAAWYSGIVTQGKTSRVVLYADASMWSAMSFTRPMGQCVGVTNYWADSADLTMDAVVTVIGAGISGALVADRLAAAGVKVLILEAGPRIRARTISTSITCRQAPTSSAAPTCARSVARPGIGSARAFAWSPTISGLRRAFALV